MLLFLALLSLAVVRLGLRPLERIAATAGAIAGGDLSRRVEPAETDTEVGRLGLALNAMLAQIETAFAERAASEDRLRRFVADASHELRTPLTSIRGYAELFRRGAAERPEDLARAMRRIEDEAARMGVLVDDLLLLARLDQGRPLERGAGRSGGRGRRRRSPTLSAVAPDRPVTFEHPDAPGHARATRPGSARWSATCWPTPGCTPPTAPRVHVRVRRLRRPGDPRGRRRGARPAARRRSGLVFDRFYRADAARARTGAAGGTGLGLSIVAAIVAAHGGTRPRRLPAERPGAYFMVALPIAPPPPPSPADAPAPPADDLPPETWAPPATSPPL